MTLGAVAAALVAASAHYAARPMPEDHARVLDGLVGWLRRIVVADDPTTGAAALARLEETPQSFQRLHELTQVLNHRATYDADFRADLEALIEQAHGHRLDISSITAIAWGTSQPPA